MAEKIDKILQSRFGNQNNLSKQLAIVKVFDIYKQEIGKLFPRNTPTPQSLKNKTLTVRAANATQANELRFHEYALIKKINAKLGKESVKRVTYRF